ncbi:MAG: twitch domain-containing radical SAM protein [Bdellovibrionales bacterium]|nr:twitch domain-containing radical SAM protein [Bdellovibrionales bacterium]
MPFAAINLYPTGGVRQCVSGTRDLGNLRQGDTLGKIWQSDDYQKLQADIASSRWPSECRVCAEREKAGLSSRRQIIAQDDWAEEIAKTNFYETPTVRFLDLAFSNRCNMWCRTCNSDFSSMWEKYEPQLSPEIRNSEFGVNLAKRSDRAVQLDQLLDILPHCKDLRRLTIKGGEPFVEPLVLRFLEELLVRDLGKQITLTFVTNASVTSPEILGVLERFKRVWLSYSIDGTDPVHRYIRGEQFHLGRLAENIRSFRRLPNLDERAVLPTVSVYNVLDLPRFYQWCQAELKTRPTFYQVLVSPEILNLKVLPLEFRALVGERLTEFRRSILPSDPKNAGHLDKIIQMLKVDNSYKDLDESREQYFAQFVKYTKEVDKLRGQSILDVIPEFAQLGVF